MQTYFRLSLVSNRSAFAGYSFLCYFFITFCTYSIAGFWYFVNLTPTISLASRSLQMSSLYLFSFQVCVRTWTFQSYILFSSAQQMKTSLPKMSRVGKNNTENNTSECQALFLQWKLKWSPSPSGRIQFHLLIPEVKLLAYLHQIVQSLMDLSQVSQYLSCFCWGGFRFDHNDKLQQYYCALEGSFSITANWMEFCIY